MTTPPPPGAADVLAARERIAGIARHTPLRPGPLLGDGYHLKLESRQETGSFKVRGAANRILAMTEDERRRGLVTVSSGNHGRAVAFVAARYGIEAVVCLTSRVPEVKVSAIAELGAEVVVAGDTQDEADAEARRRVAETGATFVHPFDDPYVIAGQGTIGLEIVADLPDVRSVVVPLSGGGLISGIALAVAAVDPSIDVIGVSQDRGPAMHVSLRAGRLTPVVEEDTLADALAGGLGATNHYTFDLCRRLVTEIVLVTEAEIGAAMAAAHAVEGETVEGGGAVGLAAVSSGRLDPVLPCAVVISGGNVSATVLADLTGGRSPGGNEVA